MNDWYDQPKPDAKPLPNWVRHVFISIATGILTGVIVAVLLILKSYILPDGKFDYELSKETWVILMALLVGAAMGLIIGAPSALIFAPFVIKATNNIAIKYRFLSRIFIGGICGYIGFFAIRLIAKSSRLFEFDFNTFIIPIMAGMIGAGIYLRLNPSAISGKDL